MVKKSFKVFFRSGIFFCVRKIVSKIIACKHLECIVKSHRSSVFNDRDFKFSLNLKKHLRVNVLRQIISSQTELFAMLYPFNFFKITAISGSIKINAAHCIMFFLHLITVFVIADKGCYHPAKGLHFIVWDKIFVFVA